MLMSQVGLSVERALSFTIWHASTPRMECNSVQMAKKCALPLSNRTAASLKSQTGAPPRTTRARQRSRERAKLRRSGGTLEPDINYISRVAACCEGGEIERNRYWVRKKTSNRGCPVLTL